jgi:hypothetical protein
MKTIIILFCVLLLSTGSAGADLLASPQNIFIKVANDDGVKNDLDGAKFHGPGDTYYLQACGVNALSITDSINNDNGQVTTINTTSTKQSGVFYVSDTGGRGYNDDLILMLSVKGPISDDFSLSLKSSGYSWTPATTASQSKIDKSTLTHLDGAIDEIFGKDDFIYDPQVFKPGSTSWSLPLYSGQTTGDPSTAEYLMFIDLYVGTLKDRTTTFPTLIDNGDVKIEYNFAGLNTTASFNIYGWCLTSNQGQGINWTNLTTGGGANGYSINYVGAPVPLPPSVLLFGSGLSGLFFYRRRKVAV